MSTMSLSNGTGPLRVGIMGVAAISFKIAIAISHPDSGCAVEAVASRSHEKAENFVKDIFPGRADLKIFSGPDCYQALIDTDMVDAVYIPLPVFIKKDFVIKSLNAGKHVVLEKPVALSAADFEEILQAAYANNKFVLDNTMFPHHKRTSDILDVVADESKLGTVQHIESSFSFMADDSFHDENVRGRSDGDPQGCVGDLGWYCIRFALLVFGKLGSKPKSVRVADCVLNKNGVPSDIMCIVHFDDDRKLLLSCSFNKAFRQSFVICGSKKMLGLNDLVHPVKSPNKYLIASSYLTKYDLVHVLDEKYKECESEIVHEVLLWKNFGSYARCIDEYAWAGDNPMIDKAKESVSISLTNQKVVDAIMKGLENLSVIEV